ncbi:MAG: substrate-binding domain-containing protein [Oscillospiraceae bacterium]|nr:substrate-binding domain-containing protein [Oscillospiraceae bacterium]
MNRKKHGLFSRIAAGALALSLAAVSSGCQQQNQSNGTIAVIAQAQGVQFWDLLQVGAVEGASELGYEISYASTAKASDIDGQRTLMQQAIANGVKGIIIAPNSPTDLNSEFERAYANDIPVITVSSNATYPGIRSYIGSDNVSAGQIAGRQLAEELGQGGEIAIISHSATAQNAQGRVQGFEDSIALLNKQAKMTLGERATDFSDIWTVSVKESSDGTREGTEEVANKVMKEHPNVKLIFATNENSTLGVCDAVSNAQKAGDIKIIGFNSNEAEISYIKTGVLTGTMVQSPYNMGYLGVRYIDKMLNGEEIRESYDTGAMYVSSRNINDDVVQLWIHPEQN